MRSFKDIKKFEDIDTYYNILELVSEIFIDRVEAHKHLVSTNKEIERLNNIIDELEKSLVNEINNKYSSNEYKQTMNLVLLKLKELKGSDKNE